MANVTFLSKMNQRKSYVDAALTSVKPAPGHSLTICKRAKKINSAPKPTVPVVPTPAPHPEPSCQNEMATKTDVSVVKKVISFPTVTPMRKNVLI